MRIKRALYYIAWVGIPLFLFALVHWRTDGFSPAAIRIPLLATPDSSQSLDFEWPTEFSYLGKGNQAFAFESLDQQYVIKFFDRRRLEIPWYHIFATQQWVNRRKSKKRIYPESYRLAYEKMREETDLLHVHMGPYLGRFPTITIKDKAARSFQIDLNETPFILQKKVSQPFIAELEKAKNQREQLRSWIDQYLRINCKRIGLYIANKDKHIKDNYRCEQKRLVYIDPGRYYLDKELSNSQKLKDEWHKTTYELRKWVKDNAPEELAYFDDQTQLFIEQTKESYKGVEFEE